MLNRFDRWKKSLGVHDAAKLLTNSGECSHGMCPIIKSCPTKRNIVRQTNCIELITKYFEEG